MVTFTIGTCVICEHVKADNNQDNIDITHNHYWHAMTDRNTITLDKNTDYKYIKGVKSNKIDSLLLLCLH